MLATLPPGEAADHRAARRWRGDSAATELASSRVYVVILNWNGWRHTIECLESVLQLRGVSVVAVVCDNGSSDGSLEQIVSWASADTPAERTAFLPHGPVAKPLDHELLRRSQVEQGARTQAQVVLIDNGANLGFAGGCNVGIRFALAQADCSHVWLLNNDSVVPADSLQALLAFVRVRPGVGICGSQVRYYDRPGIVQSFGGLLNRWLCTTHSIACGDPADAELRHPSHIDFVPGASMLVSRAFLERTGLMAEGYFLYFEEIDWAERGRPAFQPAVCPASLVFHHGSASIGSPSEKSDRGLRSEYYLLRGRLLFARRFYPARLPVVYLGLLGSLLARLKRRQWVRARIAACVALGIRPAALDSGST